MADVTSLILKAAGGDRSAQDDLYRLTEPELRKLAMHWMRRKAVRGQVRTTEVMSEAYMKLIKIDSPGWQHRGHFYAFASRNILCALIDLLRKQGPHRPAAIPEGTPPKKRGLSIYSLDALRDALEALERDLSARHRQVVELRFLGECTLDEIAKLLSTDEEALSRDRVFRISRVALAYLREKLRPSFPDFSCLSDCPKGDS